MTVHLIIGRNIRSRSRQLSLSLAALLVLLLLIGPAFVPQALRADAASRIADFAQYFDTALLNAWHSAVASRGSEHRASDSVTHTGSDSHAGALSALMVGEAPSAAADQDFTDIGSISTDSASNSMASLLGDILKDGNKGTRGNFGAFARGSGGGNAPTGSGGNANRSGGAGASTGGGGAHSSSGKSTQADSASSDKRKSEGTPSLTDLKPDAHQDRVTEPGNGSVSVYNVASASWKQAASSEPFNGLSSGGPVANNWSGGHHDDDSISAHGPANGDPVGQSLNGPNHPPQGVPSDDHHASGFQNEISDGGDSDGGEGHLVDSKGTTDNDSQTEDHGPFNNPIVTDTDPGNNPVVTEPDPGPLSSVPEPGSLVLLSLGLGAVILRDKFRFRSAR